MLIRIDGLVAGLSVTVLALYNTQHIIQIRQVLQECHMACVDSSANSLNACDSPGQAVYVVGLPASPADNPNYSIPVGLIFC